MYWSEAFYFASAMDLSNIGGVVSIPLGFVSIIALALILERLVFWMATLTRQTAVRENLLSHFHTSYPEETVLNFEPRNHPLVIFYRSVIQTKARDFESFQRRIKIGFQRVSPPLRRYDTALSTIVAISPLLGLLGTVLGLIRSFEGLGLEQPLENAEVVISGISEALVSTAIGLVIAMITLAFTNLFRSFSRTQKHELQLFATSLEEQFLIQH